MSRASKGNECWRLTVRGRVQGIGFRPLAYRCALSENVRGWISNHPDGALLEIEGEHPSLDRFVRKLTSSLPAHGRIKRIEREPIPLQHFPSFSIRPSSSGASVAAEIPPDLSICPSCLREILDPADRRYRYPFTNCTECGPRFSIVKELPYDRPSTTMKDFPLCPACQREYEEPSDRRFHAQPNACPACGPQLRLLGPDGNALFEKDAALGEAVRLLKCGKILAIKSIGGYHIAVDAFASASVRRLRQRKNRPAKPFALMLPDIISVRRLCRVSPEEEHQLTSAERPIVLLRKSASAPQSTLEILAPGNAYLGVMLPYTPLHYLLFQGRHPLRALVMTSGNRKDEPICITQEQALEKLCGIADYFLTHDRPIHNRCDDSIVHLPTTRSQRPVFIRRSRGFVLLPVPLSSGGKAAGASVFAAGAELKNTFCLTRGSDAFVSPYIGDLDNEESLAFYREARERLSRFLKVRPGLVASDLHPDYLSTAEARRLRADNSPLPGVEVQHHHAHMASVLAEKGLKAPVIGFAFDGTGLGLDGIIWGGECFLFEKGEFRRVAHFEPFPLPGGDIATHEIWRLGTAFAVKAGIPLPRHLRRYPHADIRQMIEKGVNTPLCCSAGRIFDAVAALINVRTEVSFEAQAAMELERRAIEARESVARVDNSIKKGYNFEVVSRINNVLNRKNAPLNVALAVMFREVVGDAESGIDAGVISLKFHYTMARIVAHLSRSLQKTYRAKDVVLSGGVFQNRLLLELTEEMLHRQGFRVHYNTLVPPNDGGVSLGQAWIASRQLKG